MISPSIGTIATLFEAKLTASVSSEVATITAIPINARTASRQPLKAPRKNMPARDFFTAGGGGASG
jgi:hypothetical protein